MRCPVRALAAFLLAGAARGAEPPASPARPDGGERVRIREIYVPEDEFKTLTAGRTDGIVMDLDQYRGLVLRAAGNVGKITAPVLPPLEAAVLDARYTGTVVGRTLRLRAALTVRVAVDAWVRCDLGTLPADLGGVIVDDAPGWIIAETPAAAGRQETAPGARGHLLLRGAGIHRVEMAFSLPVQEREDLATVAGTLVPAAGVQLDITVPERVDARAAAGVLEVVPGEKETRLLLAAGGAQTFTLEWKRRVLLGEKDVYLGSAQVVSCLVRPGAVGFRWFCTVSVARRKVETLTFTEPAGMQILTVTGAQVHSWERHAEGVRIRLSEAVSGDVHIEAAGVAAGDGPRVVVGPLALADAFTETGHVVLYAPAGHRLQVIEAAGMTETAGDDPGAPAMGGFAAQPPGAVAAARLYGFTSPDARVTVESVASEMAFETLAAFLAHVGETSAILEGVLRIDVTEGRLHECVIAVPPQWTLLAVEERVAQGAQAHGVRHELRERDGGTVCDLVLGRAAAASLDLRLQLEHTAFGRQGAWERTALKIELPHVEGTVRARWDLGVSLPASMDALMTQVPGWRTLAPHEIAQLGMLASIATQGHDLAAGLTTRSPTAQLEFTLVHRKARGEYRAVTHLLALERALRVRTDIRLTAVDRPLSTLVVHVPPAAGQGAVIIGDGIKAVETDAAAGTRTVQYAAAWLGTRQLRVEYETALAAGQDVPIPVVRLAPPTAEGYFGSERFLVFQSQGPVEIRAAAGEGLAPADVDELPDFAEPWAEGRVLAAHRYRATGTPGSVKTIVHERAPVLRRLARDMNLTTVIGADGVSRTQAEILLASSRDQDFTVELPSDARCLAVAVNGSPVRAVIMPTGGTASPDNVFAVPLPPQSYATVVITYERAASADGLGAAGAWREPGPRLPGIRVGQTVWRVYYPEGYLFTFAGESNLRPDDTRAGQWPGSFVASFLVPLFTGRTPRFTTFSRQGPAGERAPFVPLTDEEKQGAARLGAGEALVQGWLMPKEAQAAEPSHAGDRRAAPRYVLVPEGMGIGAWKLGGDAVLDLCFTTVHWRRFAKLTVFWSALLLGIVLYLRAGRRCFWRYVLWGLFAGMLVPLVLTWHSPLLAVPWCEALAVLLITFSAVDAVRWIARTGRVYRHAAACARLVLCGVLLSGASLAAGDAPPPDGVILYLDATRPGEAFRAGEKVYVPYEKFLELWRRAFPEVRETDETPPAAIVPGNARYHVTVQEDGARLRAAVDVNVLAKGWVLVPLPFAEAQIVQVMVDGRACGVAQHPMPDGTPVPCIEIEGPAVRRVEIELMAQVRRAPGEFTVVSGLMAGQAAVLTADLPEGAKAVVRCRGGTAPLTAEVRDGGVTVRADLGAAERIELSWSFPKIEGRSGSQVESLSYTRTALVPDGYTVERVERLRVTGRPVGAVRYAVEGAWSITDVQGVDLSEWSVLAEGDGMRLEVFFARPVESTELIIRGRARLEEQGPLATLVLNDAVRQETFVGLAHAPFTRFAADVLAGMRRVAREELTRSFAIAPAQLPDRIYHVYGSGAGELLAVEDVTPVTAVHTDIEVVVAADRAVISARSRYEVTGPGPQRHEVLVPPGFALRTVKGERVAQWHAREIPGGDGTQRLIVVFMGRAQTGTEVIWTAEQTDRVVPGRLVLPALNAAGAVRESVQWAFAADQELDVRLQDPGGLVPMPLAQLSPWIRLPPATTYRFALRSPRADAGAGVSVEVTRPPSRLAATQVLFVRVGEEFLHVNGRVIHRITAGARDRFRLALPATAVLDSIEARNQRSRDVRDAAEGVEIELILQSNVTETYVVDVTYRVPRVPGSPPEVVPMKLFDGTQPLGDVDGYVGVVQTTSTLVTAADAVGLVKVEPERMPFLPEGVSAASLQPTFRATALAWRLALVEEEIEVAQDVTAIVELAEILTVVGSDGTARTRAAYTVRNRTLQFLIVELPEGADLWGVALNGRAVAVGGAGSAGAARVLRIPVERVGVGSLNLEITLMYEERSLDLPALRGSATLKAPRIRDTKVVETLWNLHFPEGYDVSLAGGNVREVPGSARYARKVENLLLQYDKIQKAADEADSQRVRGQAQRDLARLEQILGDNLTSLQVTNRGAVEGQQVMRFGKEALQGQWAENDALIAQSQQALDQARKTRTQQMQAAPVPSRQEQAFVDTGQLIRNRWRGGKQALVPEDAVKEEPQAGAYDLEALTRAAPFGGLNGVELSGQVSQIETAQPAAVDAARGLKPVAALLAAAAAPGLEAPAEARGCMVYTFQRAGGDAELVVRYTRGDAARRLGGLLALLGVPLLVLWTHRRRARRAHAA